jgi:pimeloyl-ACP methyl ester carboxylesterase
VHRVPTRLGTLAVREIPGGPAAVGTALLWHSMFTDSRSWSRVAPALATHRRLLVVDGPGYGASAELTRVSSIDEGAAAAVEVLARLADGPVDWVGNAWGGHTGFHLAATEPDRVRSLVVISSPVQPVTPQERRRIMLMVRVLRLVGPVRPLRDAVAAIQLADPRGPLRPLLDSGLTTPTRRSLANTVESFVAGRTDITWSLPLITAPTLVVATDSREDFTPDAAEAGARALRHGRVGVVHGSGVLAPLEQPTATAELVVDFWRSLDRDEGAA